MTREGYPSCSECGHWIPPEDPTHEQRESFLADDSTEGCGACSWLWTLLLMQIMAEVSAEVKAGLAE